MFLPGGTRRGDGWRAGQAQATLLSRAPLPRPIPPPCAHAQGSWCPAHFLSAPPGWHQEGGLDTFDAQLTRISFSPRKPSHPQPLPLSSQKFFALDLHGDPREVRCLQELTIDGEMHVDIHTLQIKYTLCYIVYTNLSEDLPASPKHCRPWSEFCPLGSTDLAPFVRTLNMWPPPMGTQVCDAGREVRQVERGTPV